MIFNRILFVPIIALCFSMNAQAQNSTGNPDNFCRNGLFPTEVVQFKTAKVIGAANSKSHFFSDEDGCPNIDQARCKKKSYLVPGDQVIVSKIQGDWACSWYQPKKGSETVGWLSLKSLSIAEPIDKPAIEQWIGTWKYYSQTLSIKREGTTKTLIVSGEAYWHGLGDNVHTGDVEAKAEPNGNELKLTSDECTVVLRLIREFIVASDNLECGGANVTFNGVYTKK